MNPEIVDAIVKKFGTQCDLAELLGINQSAISRWKHRGKGVIPARQQQKILEAARARGVDLEPADFFDVREGS